MSSHYAMVIIIVLVSALCMYKEYYEGNIACLIFLFLTPNVRLALIKTVNNYDHSV